MFGRRPPRIRLLALAAVVAAIVPAVASAALWLVFKTTTAAPHTLVSARTSSGALLQLRRHGALKRHPLRLYLAPAAAAGSIRSVRDPRLVALGRLKVDLQGNGRIRFAVPNVPPGDYVTFVHCVPCAPYSGGRTLIRSGPRPGPFHVEEARPPVRSCSSSVYGQLSDETVASSVRLGPMRLIGYDPVVAAQSSWFEQFRLRTTGQYSVKVLLLVDRGPAVTLAVAPADRQALALSYIPARFNRGRVTAGDAAVTFSPCQGDENVPGANEGRTQFNGAFVLARPVCAHFEVRMEGRDPVTAALPFGRPC
jgi:hypothetical protein